jgi:RNA polymerase sigma-70 factor (ECF subfamily)
MEGTGIDLALLRRGDNAALDRMYRDHGGQVLAWVIRLGGPGLDAEDVAQDVFTQAIRLLPGFRGDAKLSTWLFALTRNVVANARRRAAFRRFLWLESVPEPPQPGDGPDELVEALRRRRMVQDALETLPTKQREALVLVDLDGRSAIEAGEMLGIPAGTVYSRVHNARRAFAEVLASRGIDAATLGIPQEAR